MSDSIGGRWTLDAPGRLVQCHDVIVPPEYGNHHLLDFFEERIRQFSPDSPEARCGLFCLRPIFTNPVTKSITVDDVLNLGAPISYYEKYEYEKMKSLFVRKDLLKTGAKNINKHFNEPIPILDFYNNTILTDKAPITTDGILKCLSSAYGNVVVPYKTDYMAGMDLGSMEEMHWLRSPLSFVGNYMPGINLPYFLVGGYSALSSCHCEDAQVGSINWLLKGSSECIWWGYETENVHATLSHVIREQIGGPRGILFDRLGYNYASNCDALLKSKSFAFHPDVEMETNGRVKVYTVVQPPGSVVITMPGAAHCVLTTGRKISSALNYLPNSKDKEEFLPGFEVKCKGHSYRNETWYHSSSAESVLRKRLPAISGLQQLYQSFLDQPWNPVEQTIYHRMEKRQALFKMQQHNKPVWLIHNRAVTYGTVESVSDSEIELLVDGKERVLNLEDVFLTVDEAELQFNAKSKKITPVKKKQAHDTTTRRSSRLHCKTISTESELPGPEVDVGIGKRKHVSCSNDAADRPDPIAKKKTALLDDAADRPDPIAKKKTALLDDGSSTITSPVSLQCDETMSEFREVTVMDQVPSTPPSAGASLKCCAEQPEAPVHNDDQVNLHPELEVAPSQRRELLFPPNNDKENENYVRRCMVYLARLSQHCNESCIRNFCKRFGTVLDESVFRDDYGYSRRSGFARFSSPAEASAAIDASNLAHGLICTTTAHGNKTFFIKSFTGNMTGIKTKKRPLFAPKNHR